jgi:hypothetical protein
MTALQLSEDDHVLNADVVDVNALTGEVIPLTDQQIQAMQRRAQDVAANLQRSATAAG